MARNEGTPYSGRMMMLWVNQVIKQPHCPRSKAVATAIARVAIQDSSSVPSVKSTIVKEGLSKKRE